MIRIYFDKKYKFFNKECNEIFENRQYYTINVEDNFVISEQRNISTDSWYGKMPVEFKNKLKWFDEHMTEWHIKWQGYSSNIVQYEMYEDYTHIRNWKHGYKTIEFLIHIIYKNLDDQKLYFIELENWGYVKDFLKFKQATVTQYHQYLDSNLEPIWLFRNIRDLKND